MAGKLSAALLSIGVNLALLASKLFVAFLTGSMAMFAECAHSGFDLLASLLAYFGIMKASEPEDSTHHFGHEKFENLSSLLQSLLITGTAFVIIFEAFQKLSGPIKVEYTEAGIALMALTIPIAYFVSRKLGEVAKREGSSALEADAAHFTTDLVASLFVLVGLVLVWLGYPLADPLSAIAVALVMLYISVELLWKSVLVFMDFAPDAETMAKIASVLRMEKRLTRFHKLRARLSGSRIFVEVNIHVPKKTSVAAAHAISHDIEKKVMRVVPNVKEVNVHIEPG